MNRSEFKKLQEEHSQSGMKLKEYFKQMGILTHQYYYWNKKYEQGKEEEGEFVPIRKEIIPLNDHRLYSLDYPNGVKLNIHTAISTLVLKELIKL